MAALLGVVFLLVLWVALFAGALLGIIGAFDMIKKTPADPVAFLIEKMKGGGGHAESAHGDDHGSQKTNIIIWVALLGLTIFEVVLAYIHIPLVLMLIVLMGLSLVKAALIMAFFMHLKFERLSFVLTVVPATVLTIVLIGVIYPDGFRLEKYRELHGELTQPSAQHAEGHNE